MDDLSKKTMMMRILEFFIEKSDDPKSKNLMSELWEQLNLNSHRIENGLDIRLLFFF